MHTKGANNLFSNAAEWGSNRTFIHSDGSEGVHMVIALSVDVNTVRNKNVQVKTERDKVVTVPNV